MLVSLYEGKKLHFWTICNDSISILSIIGYQTFDWCVHFFQIAGVDYVHFIQKNSLDRRKRTLHIDAHNESFSSRITINEHCVYTVGLKSLIFLLSTHFILVILLYPCQSLYEHNCYNVQSFITLTLTVLVATIDAQWEGMGDVGSARYKPALLPPCPTIRVLSYSN